MPVWHNSVKDLVANKQLVVLGITQEQHPERCRLFAQWKQFDWPILQDPINVMEATAVPIIIAIDEFGIVRSSRPTPATFTASFIEQTFADVPGLVATPERYGPLAPPDFAALRSAATENHSAADWATLGDALTLWGDSTTLDESVNAYSASVSSADGEPKHRFRLGVALRRRYESDARQVTDFLEAVRSWTDALERDPNQYIWRRRIEQYGPRLEKPYSFYDWVDEAEAAIRARGETPVELNVRPAGAELASPAKSIAPAAAVDDPDPRGLVIRIEPGLIDSEVTVVPDRIKPGHAARVHVVLRPNPAAIDPVHWNNEADPLRLHLSGPADVTLSDLLLSHTPPEQLVSREARRLEFEVQIPDDAADTVELAAYALFHVCDDDGGTCRFLRLDLPIRIPVKSSTASGN